ncbi:MAG: DUF2339 domain-containing protein [Myxococcota bacterium]|nr:DUF2339 domain-containing protein [Myxococcota bacterium]
MSILGLAALVLSVIALLTTRRNGPLVRRIADLERRIGNLEAARAAQAARAAAEAALREPAPAAPEPQAAPSAAPAAPGPVAPPAPELPREVALPPREPVRPPPPPSAPPPRPPWVAIDWERWVGVRGAAVLGGVVLALAGLYFFQYSIEHGLIPPWLRVVIGTLFGLGCIVAAELKARARYPLIANALVGGGVVVLYASFWASRQLYELIGTGLAFVLMISVTGACTALAYRHASLVIAMIGLIGGFATPMLLSTGQDRPIALFSYILLLDACLLFMARRRGWPILALVSLVGTLFYQAVWIGARMQAHELGLALGVLAIFAVAYAYALRTLPAEGRRQWLVTQGSAALFPFVFALYLAATADFGRHFYPVAILLSILSGAACWLGRMQRRAWLGLGAATGSVGVFAVWLVQSRMDAALAWEVMALCVLLAGVFHVFVELDPQRRGRGGPGPAAAVSALGLLFLTICSAVLHTRLPIWPWLVGWLGLVGLALRHGGFDGRGRLQVGAAGLFGLGWWAVRWAGMGPDYGLDCGVVLAVALGAQCVAMLRRTPEARRFGEHAAALFAALMLVSQGHAFHPGAQPLLALGTTSLLGLLVLLSAARQGSGGWVLAAVALGALIHTNWTFDEAFRFAEAFRRDEVAQARLGLLLQIATAVAFTAFPFFFFERLRSARFAWYASALAAPFWFPSLRELYGRAFGDATIGLLAVGLGAVSLLAAQRAAALRDLEDPRRTSNLAWFLAASLGFVTVAIPLQLEKEWITIGWALEGLAVVFLWRRLDHPGLKLFALALFAGVTVRLVGNEAVLGYYPRPEWRILNWLFYTYVLPAAAMLVAARLLAADEVERARPFEERIYAAGHPVGAIGTGLGAIAIGFVWINLAIADWFSTGDTLRVSFERLPARDLATSIAWALYALGLLAAGVRTRSGGLRWLSLGLMLVTAAKVFLYDLGELEDLYRVASLLGLAASLIAISFAYQRFVVVREPDTSETS